MFFADKKLYFKLLSVVFVTLVFFSATAQAQKKKTPAAPASKTQTSKQTAAKNQTTDKKLTAKQIAEKQILSKEKQTASKTDKNAKGKKGKVATDDKTIADKDTKDKNAKGKSAKDKNADDNKTNSAKARQAELKKQAEEKRLVEIRQAAEEAAARRREIEEARRQAALEEKRRREQAAREARERAIAFERGLHTETVQNIAADDTEGEDLEVRRAAVAALGNKAGMVVVLEPQTGKVLSIVNQDWAIRKSYKPCSTIKLVTAIAGLNEKVIDDYDGSITTRHFPMNLSDALAYSNNRYFQVVGTNFGNKKMLGYSQMLGLGRPTGINSDSETGGRLPFGNSNAKVYSHGEDFEVSPLQLAVLVSAISNGGNMVVPHIPRTKFEKTNFRMTTRGTINLPPRDLLGVVPGMIGAASYGTARRGVDSSLGIAGKTGSCIGQGTWLGLFASVAPVTNPKLAVVVITRGQAERGKSAAAVAGKIYRALSNRLKEKGDKLMIAAQIPIPLKPQPKIDAKTAAMFDDEDGEGEDVEADNDAFSKGKKGGADNAVKTQTVPNTEIARRIEKKIEKPANLFSPIVITVKKEKLEPLRLETVRREKSEMTRPRIVAHK
jgi:hypothetical protein